ncbi:MAG: hypothetical protein IPG56_11025 [Caulobacteraceae bacterium]|nr:hypothetical protein [Caulobacteraceae bacterium]
MRSGTKLGLPFPRLTAGVKRLFILAAPAAIAGGALQINVMISQALASFERGAITYLNVADRLYQLPLGLIGIAVGVAMLPRLSRLVQDGDEAGARGALDEAVALSMAFTLPAAAAMLAIPFYLIDGLYSRGAFDAADAHNAALALIHYGWGVPAFVLAKIYAPAFFAREDTKAPMRYAITSMVINVVLGAALFLRSAFDGLARLSRARHRNFDSRLGECTAHDPLAHGARRLQADPGCLWASDPHLPRVGDTLCRYVVLATPTASRSKPRSAQRRRRSRSSSCGGGTSTSSSPSWCAR